MSFLLRPVDEQNKNMVIALDPEPAFVIKSKVSGVHPKSDRIVELKTNVKIFLNVCHDSQVPKPDINFNPNIVYPLIMNNQWEIPIVTSSIREDTDKKGGICYVSDCCINSECIQWISKDLQLREILIEWCLESCELREALEISRENIAFPKMKKKGDLIPKLEILSEELTNDYQQEISNAIESEKLSDPISIFKMRRDLIDEENDSTLNGTYLPPLFPNSNSQSPNKPLIQELNDLSLSKPQMKPKIHRPIFNDLNFEVTMRKTTSTDMFKLRLDIKSEISSSLDLNLQYYSETNELLLKNINLNEFEEKHLRIPLPNIFSHSDISNMKTFFIKCEKKLIIFI